MELEDRALAGGHCARALGLQPSSVGTIPHPEQNRKGFQTEDGVPATVPPFRRRPGPSVTPPLHPGDTPTSLGASSCPQYQLYTNTIV